MGQGWSGEGRGGGGGGGEKTRGADERSKTTEQF